jgi:hypothetical protein
MKPVKTYVTVLFHGRIRANHTLTIGSSDVARETTFSNAMSRDLERAFESRFGIVPVREHIRSAGHRLCFLRFLHCGVQAQI